MPIPHSLQYTPIESLISSAWRRISSRLGTTNIDEDHFALFTIWIIDTLCEIDAHRTDPADFHDDLYDAVKQFLKSRNISAIGNDIEQLTEGLFDVQYYLWGLILRGSENLPVDIISIYSLLDKCIGERRKQSFEISESFRFKDTENLKIWFISYIESDTSLTTPDIIEWNQEELGFQAAELVAHNSSNAVVQNIINLNNSPLNITGGAQIGIVVENAEQFKK